MKAVSFVLSGVGNIMVSLNENELVIDTEVLELAYKYYKNSLIKCRHKGVIESSFTSLTHFCKALANITSFWKELVKWCYDVLQAAVDLRQNASVTKRSAGIPMFIQAILSAEPASENHESLHKYMKYLVDVARTELPTDINFTVDLPQFNAINIMRAIFRDATLGNTVLPFVEDAVMLTINGFSSPSWSIRNASTILLGTLVPRMLGQRISQEENSQQNASTVDVFFYRYPKLVSYFQTCLLSQLNTGDEYGANFIAPHVIPALTFLSKLSSSSLENCTKLSSIFLPMLNSFTVSPVFTIREIATSSIIAFTPEENDMDLIKETLSNLLTEDDNNKIHSLCTLLVKTLKTAKSSKESICHFILNHYKNHNGIPKKIKCDLLSHGVVIELLLECFYTSKIYTLDILFDHLDKCLTHTEQLSHVAVGKPIFLKSLVKVIMAILCDNLLEEKGFRVLTRVQDSCCKDLHILFFNGVTQYTESIQKSLNNQIFLFTIKTILESKCKILLEASLSCLEVLLNKNIVSLVTDVSELMKCLFKLVNTTQRFIPYLLPSIVKIFKYSELIFKDEIFVKMAGTLANLLNEFSCSEQSEHLRLAAARSIGLLEQLIHGYGSYNEERLFEQALHRCVITALRLIQDEDEMIRQETNSHLQFLNITSAGNDHSYLQCNITLKNLFKFIEINAIHKEMYFRWLLELFVTCEDEDDTHEKCDLMLFEQEASNLYAEEMIVIDLTFRSLKNVLTAVSREPDPAQLFHSYSRLYKETVFPACKKNIYLLKCSQTNYRKYPVKNVYGLFGTRRNFITMYKVLKCLLIFQICVVDEDEKVEIKEFCIDEIISIIGKCCLHPVLKDIYIQLAA